MGEPPIFRIIDDRSAKEETKSYGKISWFVGGLLLGSVLDPFTVAVMVGVGLLIDNHPLPSIMGALTPQDFTLLVLKSLAKSGMGVLARIQQPNK